MAEMKTGTSGGSSGLDKMKTSGPSMPKVQGGIASPFNDAVIKSIGSKGGK